MKRQPLFPKTSSPRSQSGIATILIVVLIGVALTATSMSIMHSMRSTQEKQIAVHAATNAQTGAWAGVEAFRLYLDAQGVGGLTNGSEYSIALTGYGTMAAKNILVTPTGTGHRVEATIVNTLAAAHSSASVGVVYEEPTADDCPGCVTLAAALDFHDNLTLTGGLTFEGGSEPLVINVDGDVTMTSVSAPGISHLNATGAITLGSSVDLHTVHSNDKVTLDQGAKVNSIKTTGTVEILGGSQANYIQANGTVTLAASGSTKVESLANIVVSQWSTHSHLNAKGNITVNAGPVLKAEAKGDITVTSSTIKNIVVEGKLKQCGYHALPTTLQVKDKNFIECSNTTATTAAKTLATLGANVTVMDPVPEVAIPRTTVDVWTMKDQANFVVERVSDRTRVTVQHIRGIADGTEFWRFGTGNQYKTECEVGGACTVQTLQLCNNTSGDSVCLGYDNGKWSFSNQSVVPGIFWLDGDLSLSTATPFYTNTMLATGDITTVQDFTIKSVNYAGPAGVCSGSYIPSNLCGDAGTEYLAPNIGNIALAAGGYRADQTYSGGDITTGNKSFIYGAVLAGNYLSTGGQSEIFGYVTAAAHRKGSGGSNRLDQRTNLDLTKGTEHYTPNKIPDMSGGNNPNPGPAPAPSGARVLWSKYL